MAKKVTIVFLLRDDEVCLGMKKRGFGVGLWNGTGGKVINDETPEDAAKREAKEELLVDVDQLEAKGETLFIFKDGLEINCHIFLCRRWRGEPGESEEMAPKWFDINKLPLDSMWETDVSWLPLILGGKSVKGIYYFNDDGKTVKKFDLKEI